MNYETTKIPDQIFDEAIIALKKGQSIQQISERFPEYQKELVGLLSIVKIGSDIPKLSPPAPYKRHLYAEKAIINSGTLAQLLTFAKVAIVPVSIVMVLLGGGAVLDATENSLPGTGNPLYTLKRASEEARLTITRDQEKVAIIHVELLQKRLDEVRKAADSGNSDTESAAIAELKSQTEKTFAEVAPVATANALSKQDSGLLDTLVAVNKEQKDVLTEVSEKFDQNSAKIVAMTALEDTKKNDETIAKIIATVNEQSLADLPNKISVTGIVSSNNAEKITVEKNTFAINAETSFIAADGTELDSSDIASAILKSRVTITGTRIENGTLLAKKIQVLAVDDGAVKGDATTTSKPVAKPATKPTQNATSTAPATTSSQPTVEQPPKATGGFIVEQNDQQYAP